MELAKQHEEPDKPPDIKVVKETRKIPRTPVIEFRLLPENNERLERLSRLDGKTKTDLVRAAVSHYLDARENNLLQDRDASLDKILKKGFNRLAALQVRAALDIGVVYNLIYKNLPDENREKILRTAYREASDRLRTKLTGQEAEFKELLGQ